MTAIETHSLNQGEREREKAISNFTIEPITADNCRLSRLQRRIYVWPITDTGILSNSRVRSRCGVAPGTEILDPSAYTCLDYFASLF